MRGITIPSSTTKLTRVRPLIRLIQSLNPRKIILYFSNYKKNIKFATYKASQIPFRQWHNH